MSNEPSESEHHSGQGQVIRIYIFISPVKDESLKKNIWLYLSRLSSRFTGTQIEESTWRDLGDGQSIIRSAGETSSIQMMTINSQSKIFIKSPLMLYIIIIHRAVSFENEGNILQTAPHSLPLNYIFPMNVF